MEWFFLPTWPPRLVAYAQALARRLLEERPVLSEDIYLPYTYNRFQACRFGLQGELIDAASGARRGLAEDVRATLESVRPHARELACEEALDRIAATLRAGSDAQWMREIYAGSESLPDLVYRQAERWRGRRLR